MVIRYFYVMRIAIHPFKANAILIIYADTILVRPITLEFFQVISGN